MTLAVELARTTPPRWSDPKSTDASPSAEFLALPGAAPLWPTALEADEHGVPGFPLPRLWDDVVHGRVSTWWESVGAERILLIARVTPRGRGLCPQSASVIARVFCGDPQKVVASDLGIAPSTASGRYVKALEALEVSPRMVPLSLILAAQSAAGLGPIATARSCVFDHQETACLVVSVPRPAMARMTALTTAEQDVAQWIMEGYSRWAIARHRMTSVHTVSRQFHSIFETLKVTGRFALIRRAVELHGFR